MTDKTYITKHEEVEELFGPPTKDPLWPPTNIMDNWNDIRARVFSIIEEQEREILQLRFKASKRILIRTEYDPDQGLYNVYADADDFTKLETELSQQKKDMEELKNRNGECVWDAEDGGLSRPSCRKNGPNYWISFNTKDGVKFCLFCGKPICGKLINEST